MIIIKPWLFDILACPIDKHFPLKLLIFSFETKQEEIQSFLKIYENRDLTLIKKENIIKLLKEGESQMIKDNVIIEESRLSTYLELIISSINELENIEDKSSLELAKKCLNIILTKIKDKIIEFSKKPSFNDIEDILPELYFVNKYKIDTEIESGLLFCEECNRWFPIIETIPQMLPDKYREKDKDIQFLKSNAFLLDEEFMKLDLKPHGLS